MPLIAKIALVPLIAAAAFVGIMVMFACAGVLLGAFITLGEHHEREE